jgi:hypothetical protein
VSEFLLTQRQCADQRSWWKLMNWQLGTVLELFLILVVRKKEHSWFHPTVVTEQSLPKFRSELFWYKSVYVSMYVCLYLSIYLPTYRYIWCIWILFCVLSRAELKLTIFLPPCSKCWDYRDVAPCLADTCIFLHPVF